MISQEIFTNFGSLELQAASEETGAMDSRMTKSKPGVGKKAHALLTAETEEESTCSAYENDEDADLVGDEDNSPSPVKLV